MDPGALLRAGWTTHYGFGAHHERPRIFIGIFGSAMHVKIYWYPETSCPERIQHPHEVAISQACSVVRTHRIDINPLSAGTCGMYRQKTRAKAMLVLLETMYHALAETFWL